MTDIVVNFEMAAQRQLRLIERVTDAPRRLLTGSASGSGRKKSLPWL
jgi:hypothetical protein